MPVAARAKARPVPNAGSSAPASLTPSTRQMVWVSSASKMPTVPQTLASAAS